MYREKKYEVNGFRSQDEFIEMMCWLRQNGATLESIGSLYHVTKVYVGKKTAHVKPDTIINRKPKSPSHQARQETHP